jgi:hypothetical protein
MLLVLSPKTNVMLKKLHYTKSSVMKRYSYFYCEAVSILLTQRTRKIEKRYDDFGRQRKVVGERRHRAENDPS